MQDGGGLDPRIPKIYNTCGLWLIVSDIGFLGSLGGLGCHKNKVMVQVVINLSYATNFTLLLF